MGSDESHFNGSVGSDGQNHKTVSTNHNLLMVQQEVMDKNHKTVSTNHNLFEEKGEPKWYRTEVLLFISLLPYF